jgi:3-oxoacyl-[acyl-carrier protein] reductase
MKREAFFLERNLMSVKGKVILLTGAGRGIGREAALLLARNGARLAVCDRDAEALQALMLALDALGAEGLGLPSDVTRRAEMDELVAQASARWGTIDVLINNAGIVDDAMLKDMAEAQFDRVIEVNLKGMFHCAQAVLPIMRQQGHGKIINASSVSGTNGNIGQTNYAAAKAGIIGMTKTWAKELGPLGITSNAVAPGFIETEMTASVPAPVLAMLKEHTPLRRLGRATDVAQAYLFLASSASDFINGLVLTVDGGLSL